MTPFQQFMTNKPNPPEHAAFMARAAKKYPSLPPGAQQNALHCFETRGARAAARYASNARSRHPIPKPWVCPSPGYRGVCKLTKKERAERAEGLERLRAWYAQHALGEERVLARAAFHGWLREHVPNGTNWRDANPPARVVDAYNVGYGA